MIITQISKIKVKNKHQKEYEENPSVYKHREKKTKEQTGIDNPETSASYIYL